MLIVQVEPTLAAVRGAGGVGQAVVQAVTQFRSLSQTLCRDIYKHSTIILLGKVSSTVMILITTISPSHKIFGALLIGQ